jgi:hypothetical protein
MSLVRPFHYSRLAHFIKPSSDQKILDTLKGPLPQVTFSCDTESDACLFQFWIGGNESFYCGLDTCKISATHSFGKDALTYDCENLKCQCIKDRMLCGEAGSVGEWCLSDAASF